MLADMPDYPRIPYGLAYFPRIRRDGALYVDKTRFLRRLEEVDYAVFIRPRRFGKSLWISVLEHYYDRHFADEFSALFDGTDIGRNPTHERGSHIVLRFDFSAFGASLDKLEERFEEYCAGAIRFALLRNSDLFPRGDASAILAPSSVAGQLNALFRDAAGRGIGLYALIDEYDNFANNLLASKGENVYRDFTHGGGFFRDFFATLKAGAGQGALRRLFITGVSPITLDDVTSGFNMGDNISLDARFNELLGFTEAEVRGLLELYRDCGAFGQDVDEALDIMREWYGGYRFAEVADTTLYNTDMVLYYLNKSILNRVPPRRVIDQNARVDYTKLRHLLVVSNRLNGNFDLLRHLAGEERVEVDLQPSFPLERLNDRDNFLSLMHHFGLLSIRDASGPLTVLCLPNRAVRHFIYDFLRSGYRDMDLFALDRFRLLPLMERMAVEGEWMPVFEMIAECIEQFTGIRDYIAGEKVLQGFLAAYLSLSQRFLLRSEGEYGKGFADLSLEPDVARYPNTRYGYLVELKYLKRGDNVEAARIDALRGEAAAQLLRYLADGRLGRQYPGVRFIGLVLVFHGWEMVATEAVEAMSTVNVG